MVTSSDTLRSQLQAFAEENRAIMSKGRDILTALNDPRAIRQVNKPLLLKLILEKYLELIEDKLLLALPQTDNSDVSLPDISALGSSSLPTEEAAAPQRVNIENPKGNSGSYSCGAAHAIDDFRSTDPRFGARQPGASASERLPRTLPTTPSAPCSERTKAEIPADGVGMPHALNQLNGDCIIENTVGSRRTIPRYKCHMPLSYTVAGQDRTTIKAFTRNVGALGLYITASHPQKVGDQIKIEFEMPDKEKATLQGVVRWTKWVPQNLRSVDLPGFGVRITSAPENWYSYFINTPRH